jgi:hypothetical protein
VFSDLGVGRKLVSVNADIIFSSTGLAVDKRIPRNNGGKEEFRGKDGYFYADGPEFRLEYIHDRVEY